MKADSSAITHNRRFWTLTCPEQLQHAGYTVERRAELADITAAVAPTDSGCTCGDRTFPGSRHQIVEAADQEQSRSGIGLSGANTRYICHGGEGVRMISGRDPENSRVSRADQKRTMSVEGQPKRHSMKKPTRGDAHLAARLPPAPRRRAQ